MTPVPRDKLDTTAMAEANDAEAAVVVVNGPEDGPVDWDAVQWACKQSGEVDHAAWGGICGIHGLAVRASRMASIGRRPWLRALTR
jgi:hypothetical protein